MLTLRSASIEDCLLIRTLAEEAFPATYRSILTPAQLNYMMEWMYSPKSLKRQMEEGHQYFIATTQQTPCGYLSIQRESQELFHLQKIYLLPAFQGRGFGATMFQHAVAYIRSVHPAPCRMELNVNRDNPALHFYERMGMTRLREGDFPIGEGYFMHDYIMELEIK